MTTKKLPTKKSPSNDDAQEELFSSKELPKKEKKDIFLVPFTSGNFLRSLATCEIVNISGERRFSDIQSTEEDEILAYKTKVPSDVIKSCSLEKSNPLIIELSAKGLKSSKKLDSYRIKTPITLDFVQSIAFRSQNDLEEFESRADDVFGDFRGLLKLFKLTSRPEWFSEYDDSADDINKEKYLKTESKVHRSISCFGGFVCSLRILFGKTSEYDDFFSKFTQSEISADKLYGSIYDLVNKDTQADNYKMDKNIWLGLCELADKKGKQFGIVQEDLFQLINSIKNEVSKEQNDGLDKLIERIKLVESGKKELYVKDLTEDKGKPALRVLYLFAFYKDIESISGFEKMYNLDKNSKLLIYILIGINLKIGSFLGSTKGKNREELNCVSQIISDIYHGKSGNISIKTTFNSEDAGGDDTDTKLIKYNKFDFLEKKERIDHVKKILFESARQKDYAVYYDEEIKNHYLSKKSKAKESKYIYFYNYERVTSKKTYKIWRFYILIKKISSGLTEPKKCMLLGEHAYEIDRKDLDLQSLIHTLPNGEEYLMSRDRQNISTFDDDEFEILMDDFEKA